MDVVSTTSLVLGITAFASFTGCLCISDEQFLSFLLRRMIKPETHQRTKGYFVALCFLLLLLNPNQIHPQAADTAHVLKKAPVADILDCLSRMAQRLGLSSLELEIHGASLDVSEMVDHLGPFLSPALRDWNPSGEMMFDFTVAATANHRAGGTRIRVDLRLRNASFSSPDSTKRGTSIGGEVRASLDVPEQPDRPAAIRADLSLETGKIAFGNFRFDFRKDPVRLDLTGSYDTQNHCFPSLFVRFQTPSLGEGTIKAAVRNLDNFEGEAEITLGPISNGQALALFVKEPFGHVSPVLRESSIDGQTLISAVIRGSLRRYSIDGLLDVSAGGLAAPSHEIEAKGLEIRLPFFKEFPSDKRSISPIGSNSTVDGLIRAKRIQWKSYEWRNAAVPVAFRQNALLVGQTSLPILGGVAILKRARIQDPLRKTMEIIGGMRLDRLDLSEVTNRFGPLSVPGSLEGDFSMIRVSRESLVTRGSLTIHTLGGQIEVSNIQARTLHSPLHKVSMDMRLRDVFLEERSLGSILPATLLDYTLSGMTAIGLTVDTRIAQEPDATGVHLEGEIREGAFSSPDETKLGENVQGKIHVDVNIPANREKRASFQGDLDLEAGEVLLGSFYFDFERDPLRLGSMGVYDLKKHRLASLTIQFDAPTLGRGRVTGTLEPPNVPQREVEVALGPISNERAFDLFVREPFGHASPMLKQFSINGETRITASIRGSDARYSVQGLLETSIEDLVVPTHEIKAKGVKIQLPFLLNVPVADGTVDSGALRRPLTGFVHSDWARWKSEEWRDVSVPLVFMENALYLPQEMKLPIWGGTLILEGPKIDDPFAKAREITLGLRLEGLDFSRITGTFVPFSLPGSLEGNFFKIKVLRDSLTTQGNLTIHTLGGRIEVNSIHGTTPFSRLRRISMNVLLKDINLEEASRSFKFGQMGGIIEGKINDLAFSFGQPEKFELEIRSVKKRGVKQYVNAEAVNNLSILSTGAAYAFRRSLLQLFEYFPYARLGIYCKLENDVFTLRGTIRQGGVEYLIRRGVFRGIDVVNQNPENRIRWKQMLKRLKAIGQGTADVKISTQK